MLKNTQRSSDKHSVELPLWPNCKRYAVQRGLLRFRPVELIGDVRRKRVLAGGFTPVSGVFAIEGVNT